MKTYTKEFLDDKADKMFEYLRKPMPSMQNEDEVINRLGQLGRMLSESGEFKAAAQYMVDDVVNGHFAETLKLISESKMAPSTLNKHIGSLAKDWSYLVNAFDRINSAAGKMIMAIQTLVSYEKEKMKIL